MYSPRLGFAYRPKLKIFKETVIRGGYGINYNTGQYATIARAAGEPATLCGDANEHRGAAGVWTLEQFTLADAFNCSNAAVQSNYSALT